MTTKPKAKKFRIRRSSPLATMATPGRATDDEVEDGFGDERFPTAAPDDVLGPAEVSAEQQIADIRLEGLTGRQLRMARRVALKHGIAATSDFDAVRQLRKAGLDPFQRATMLDLVVSDDNGVQPPGAQGASLPVPSGDNVKLPSTVKPAQLPSTETTPPGIARGNDIQRIQMDIARRRRRRFVLMTARLAFFVGLPTLLAGYYFYKVATPLYATKSEFVIQKAEPGAASSQMGSLFAGTQFATSQDSISVQSYLQSRDALRRLDKDMGFNAAFEGKKIDPILRLPDNASNSDAYGLYQREVKIGYDPTEGVIKMEVVAPTPQKSEAFSRALISYAEQKVDKMTQRLREDQMTGAHDSYDNSEKKLAAAQKRVVELQQKFKVLSSDVEVTLVTSQIQALDAELTKDNLSLTQIMSNTNPTKARVEPLKRRIKAIEDRIATLRSHLTQDDSTGVSLAQVQSDLLAAQADVQTRQLMLAQALQALETSRIEANRQVRYLSLSVSPMAPDRPTYPRAFENTLVAFLLFAGLYLMVSMTVSILREQVSA